ncbi:MAG: S-layer homology domain-containing protein [Oscillospiraceae bacterium]|nr:S-layer homology domain-containing protein [Oscillospiraceae bacterium]
MKKRVLTVLLVVLLLVSLFAPAAGAVNYTHFAEDLHALGLFQGVGRGNFELDRTPTRAEALVMLIRLLGLEEAAHASDYAHPFTDVSGWSEGYVAFAYMRGLTYGTSATTFEPNAAATAQMYVLFVLRALGYDDHAGDFTWQGALRFGREVGVWDPMLAGDPFLRDQLAAVSYLALLARTADSESRLLEVLVADGVVSAAAAAPILERVARYTQYLSLRDALARGTVTGGSSVRTITASTVVDGVYREATMEEAHDLPANLLEFLSFDAYPFAALVLSSEISGSESGGQTVLVRRMRDAHVMTELRAIAAALAAETDEAAVAGTPRAIRAVDRLTLTPAGRVTTVERTLEFTVPIRIEGVTMTVEVRWVTALTVG